MNKEDIIKLIEKDIRFGICAEESIKDIAVRIIITLENIKVLEII